MWNSVLEDERGRIAKCLSSLFHVLSTRTEPVPPIFVGQLTPVLHRISLIKQIP